MRGGFFQGIVGNDVERKNTMTSILEEFAYGNLSPEVGDFQCSSKYGEALRLLSLNEKNLMGRLNDEEKLLFEKYVDAQGELDRLTAVGNFVYGYKMGLTMTAEAFVDMGDLFMTNK